MSDLSRWVELSLADRLGKDYCPISAGWLNRCNGSLSLAGEQIDDVSSAAAILDRISTGWQIEALWRRDPDDDLFLLLLTGDVDLPVRVLQQDKSACGKCRVSPSLVWYSALPLSLTVSNRSGTLCQPTLRRYAGEADTRRRIMSRKLERRDTAKDRPRWLGCPPPQNGTLRRLWRR